MGKFNQKRKIYFKKSQKLKQLKIRKEIEDEDKDSENSDLETRSDLEASSSGEEAEGLENFEESDDSSGEESENEVKIVNIQENNEPKGEEKEGKEEKSEKPENSQNPPKPSNPPKGLSKGRWKNKQRLLILGSRGINTKIRHLIDDFSSLMPHSKQDVKVNKQQGFMQLNEIAEMKNCQNVLFFEARKKQDTFLWISPDIENGPTIRFLVENIHTTSELRFTGNCLARSRPLLSFHNDFEANAEFKMIKLCLQKTFNTPKYHPKSQPFIDHIFNFSILDNKIWFRNYQIDPNSKDVVEIGPRMTLTPAAIFSKSFFGEKVWKNEHFTSPNERRRLTKMYKLSKKSNPVERMESKIIREIKLDGLEKYKLDKKDEVFD